MTLISLTCMAYNRICQTVAEAEHIMHHTPLQLCAVPAAIVWFQLLKWSCGKFHMISLSAIRQNSAFVARLMPACLSPSMRCAACSYRVLSWSVWTYFGANFYVFSTGQWRNKYPGILSQYCFQFLLHERISSKISPNCFHGRPFTHWWQSQFAPTNNDSVPGTGLYTNLVNIFISSILYIG